MIKRTLPELLVIVDQAILDCREASSRGLPSRTSNDRAAVLLGELRKAFTPLVQEYIELKEQKDGAYEERNRCVALVARMLLLLGGQVAVTKTEIEGWSPEWHNCVYMWLPTGQVSWHFHDKHSPLFEGLPRAIAKWDGHDTPKKYARVDAAYKTTEQQAKSKHAATMRLLKSFKARAEESEKALAKLQASVKTLLDTQAQLKDQLSKTRWIDMLTKEPVDLASGNIPPYVRADSEVYGTLKDVYAWLARPGPHDARRAALLHRVKTAIEAAAMMQKIAEDTSSLPVKLYEPGKP